MGARSTGSLTWINGIILLSRTLIALAELANQAYRRVHLDLTVVGKFDKELLSSIEDAASPNNSFAVWQALHELPDMKA